MNWGFLKRIDLAHLIPALLDVKSDGKVDINDAVNVYRNVVKPAIDKANADKAAAPKPTATTPDGQTGDHNTDTGGHPVPPVPVPTPHATTPAATNPADIVRGIKNAGQHGSGVLLIQEWQGGKPGTGGIAKKERFDAIIAGNDAVGRGASITYDRNPLDANGREIGPGDPRHEQVNGGKPYLGLRVRFNGQVEEVTPDESGKTLACGLEVHSLDGVNRGCTSRVKVPADWSGGNNNTVETQSFLLSDPSISSDYSASIRISD